MPGTRCAGLALAGARMPLRTPVVLLFLAAAPTMGVAGLLRGLDAFARIFAACAAAIIINVMVAERMLAAGAWSPDGGLVVVVVITRPHRGGPTAAGWYTDRGRARTDEVDNLTERSR